MNLVDLALAICFFSLILVDDIENAPVYEIYFSESAAGMQRDLGDHSIDLLLVAATCKSVDSLKIRKTPFAGIGSANSLAFFSNHT